MVPKAEKKTDVFWGYLEGHSEGFDDCIVVRFGEEGRGLREKAWMFVILGEAFSRVRMWEPFGGLLDGDYRE